MTNDMSEQVLDRRMTPPPRALLGLRGQLWDNPNLVQSPLVQVLYVSYLPQCNDSSVA